MGLSRARLVNPNLPLLFILAFGLWIALSCGQDSAAQAVAEKARDQLIDGLTEGQSLYMRLSRYDSIASNPDTIEESWMLVGSDDMFIGFRSEVRDLNGDRVSSTTSRNGTMIHTDFGSNETMTLSDPIGSHGMVAWVKKAWEGIDDLESGGFTYTGEGTLYGRVSAIFTKTTKLLVSESEGEATWRYEVEVVRDAPLLHRQSIYDAQDGGEVLLDERSLLEYSVRFVAGIY